MATPKRSFAIKYDGNSSDLNSTEARLELIELNDRMAMRYLPVIIYIFLLMITGIVGNTLVCFVFAKDKNRRSVNYFILTLAVLDLLNCVIGMPNEIVDLRYPYMFYSPVACKVLRTIEYISTVGSTVVLLAVAIDRYNRICNLGKHMSSEKARKVCIAAVTIGVITAWPVPILGGLSKVDVNIDDAQAVDCSIDENMKETVYPPILYGLLGIYFICCIIFFVITYSRIVIFVKKRKFMSRNISTSSGNGEQPKTEDEHKKRLLNHNNTPNNSVKTVSNGGSFSNKHNHGIKVTRTTVILGVVTFVFIVGYLPYLVIMAIRTIQTNFEERLSASGDIAMKFCVKSYLINNAINPIIYCFLNKKFRADVKKMFSTCCR